PAKAVPIDAMFRRLAISGIGSLEKVTSAVGIAGREQAANNECVRKRAFRASMRPRPVSGTVGFTDVGRTVEGTASVWGRPQ
ncbi:MAG TPA: hypothetical protein VGA15_20410, partial [Bradyrhizobium sp.]